MSHFDDRAINWDTDKTISRSREFALAVNEIIDSLDEELDFLDFGCGTGLLSQFFVNTSKSLVGVDASSGMIQAFNTKFKDNSKVKSFNVNIEDVNFPESVGPFDVIMSSMTFHHLSDPKKILSYLKDNLKKTGAIVVIDLEKEDGSFHPNNDEMGVRHFGFSKEDYCFWVKNSDLELTDFKQVYVIEKNSKRYAVNIVCFKFSPVS